MQCAFNHVNLFCSQYFGQELIYDILGRFSLVFLFVCFSDTIQYSVTCFFNRICLLADNSTEMINCNTLVFSAFRQFTSISYKPRVQTPSQPSYRAHLETQGQGTWLSTEPWKSLSVIFLTWITDNNYLPN